MRTFASLFKRFSQQPIKNDGSQARDHLANERTFLAWTRTSVTFAAMALALGRLDYIDQLLHSSAIFRPSPIEGAEATETHTPKPDHHRARLDLMGYSISAPHAPTLCSAISAWCLGYGLIRYTGGARRLLANQFLPARNGPVVLTLGVVSLFGAMAFNHDIQQNTGQGHSMKKRTQSPALVSS